MHNYIYKKFIIHHFKELASTNTHAFNLANNRQIFHNEIVISNKQTAGKGRKNRNWTSEDNENLYFSIILQPKINIQKINELSFISAIALRKTVESLDSGQKNIIQLKWPNDLIVNGKKTAGILLESQLSNNEAEFIVVGIGVNICDYPKDTMFQATSLQENNIITTKKILLEKFLDEFEMLYDSWLNFGFTKLKNLWLKNAYKLNEEIEVKVDNEAIKGVFIDIDDNANLILKNRDKQIKINTGDVF